MKHKLILSCSAVLLSLTLSLGANAGTTYRDYLKSDTMLSPTVSKGAGVEIEFEESELLRGVLSLDIDSYKYPFDYFVYRGTMYVGLRDFSCFVDNSVVTWDEKTETAFVSTESLYVSAPLNRYFIEANGRILWCKFGVVSVDDVTYVPLRQIASSFGFEVEYSEENESVSLKRESGAILSADEFYDQNELYWLSQIIHAESKGEPFLGKLAVGNVILNRVDSDEFPDDIVSVIFDSSHGVQFTPTVNGAINEPAGVDSVIAAKLCLENTRLSREILYFLNEEIAASKWIVENCTHVISIGDHDFYAP